MLSWSTIWCSRNVESPYWRRGPGHRLHYRTRNYWDWVKTCYGAPKDWVNIRPKKKTVILCIDPDSDSDIVIEEGEGDFRERCIIIKGEEWDVEEEAEQADDEQSEPLITGRKLSLECLWLLNRRLKTKMKQFPALWLRILIEKEVQRECINLTSHYQQIRESFKEIGRRGATYEEASTGNPFCKDAYTTHGQSDYWRESVICVWTTLWRRT